MKLSITFILLMFVLSSSSQPTSFSWYSNDSILCNNYISSAKDQGEQGPCFIFASVAAVKATCISQNVKIPKPLDFLINSI